MRMFERGKRDRGEWCRRISSRGFRKGETGQAWLSTGNFVVNFEKILGRGRAKEFKRRTRVLLGGPGSGVGPCGVRHLPLSVRMAASPYLSWGDEFHHLPESRNTRHNVEALDTCFSYCGLPKTRSLFKARSPRHIKSGSEIFQFPPHRRVKFRKKTHCESVRVLALAFFSYH
jgi:hypothetical protein